MPYVRTDRAGPPSRIGGREERAGKVVYPVRRHSRLPGSSSGCYTIENIRRIKILIPPSGECNGLTGPLRVHSPVQFRFWERCWPAGPLFPPPLLSHHIPEADSLRYISAMESLALWVSTKRATGGGIQTQPKTPAGPLTCALRSPLCEGASKRLHWPPVATSARGGLGGLEALPFIFC